MHVVGDVIVGDRELVAGGVRLVHEHEVLAGLHLPLGERGPPLQHLHVVGEVVHELGAAGGLLSGGGISGALKGAVSGIKDKITAYAVFNNFFNFLDQHANINRRRDFGGRQEIAGVSGVDSPREPSV